jgi:hypothetical protein
MTTRHAELISASHMQSIQELNRRHASRRPGKREYPVRCRNKFGMTVTFLSSKAGILNIEPLKFSKAIFLKAGIENVQIDIANLSSFLHLCTAKKCIFPYKDYICADGPIAQLDRATDF